MTLTEIISIVSGLASFTVIVGFVWRAISKFNAMEFAVKDLARQVRLLNRRLDRLEGKPRVRQR